MKKTLTTLWLLLLTVGVIFPNFYESLFDRFQFGAVSFPTSLDSFSNPGATDSVATVVTHSTHHGNANDALEAVEAKVGITASTPVTGSLFAGNGSGSSIWTTYATGTSAWFSGLGTFGNLLSTGSSTIVGGLNITGNSTTTNATSTIGVFTDFATSTKYFGAGLGACSGGSSAVQWTNGSFSCGTITVSAVSPTTYATSSGSTSYKVALSINMTAGDVLMGWVSCQRAAANAGTTLKVRDVRFVASTSLSVASGANPNATVFGLWQATSTSDVHMEASASACDSGDGLQLMTMLING